MMDSFSLHGKKVLVTGASSGIGKQIAVSISLHGGTCIITGRNEKKLAETFKSLNNNITPNQCITCDLSKQEEMELLVQEISNLDGVVFTAGVINYTPIRFLSEKHLHEIFSINFDANVLLTQKLLSKKKINTGASLVYTSSISSHLGVPGTAIYAASKAALNSFAKVLASELSVRKIRSNVITPGIIRTNLFEGVSGKLNEEEFNKQEGRYPLGFGASRDVANAAIYLLSPASKWVTGTELVIDGGLTLQ